MWSNSSTAARGVFKLLLVVTLLVPVLASWVGVVDFPAVGTGTTIRLVGLGIVAVVAWMLVRQKRRSRGQQTETDVEATGEEYYR